MTFHRTNRCWAQGLIFVAACAMLCTHACKPTAPKIIVKDDSGKQVDRPPKPNESEEAEANRLLTQSKAMTQARNARAAEALREEILREHPATAAAAQIYEARAEFARAEGRIAEAVSYYEKILFYRPTYTHLASVREHYGALLLELARYADAVHILRPLFEEARATEEKWQLGSQLVAALRQNGRADEALRIQVDLHRMGGVSQTQREQSVALAESLVATDLAFNQAKTLWDDVSSDDDWAFVHPILAYKLAKIYYHTRQYEQSKALLLRIVQDYGQTAFGGPAKNFLHRLENRFRVDADAIGVLLPLSGRFAQYGQRARQAIELGFGHINRIRITIKDTAGDPIIAAKAVEELVLQDHVIGIIGPLFSKPAMAAALKAEELSVPLLSLSYRSGIPEIGPHIFRIALTVEAQAKALAQVSMEQLGMRNFVLLYPRSTYGTVFAKVFWDEIQERKGFIRGVESYEHNQTTFQSEIRKVVGRYYRYARPSFRDKIDELKEQKLEPHKFKAALDRFYARMPPVIDFDAIVIPDSGRNLGLIAPALAFEDIVLTQNEKALETMRKSTRNNDLRPVKLLGGSTWNSPQTLAQCERYCEGSIFVDGFFADSPNAAVRDFVSVFEQQVGSPPRLTDAQAFDAAGLMRWSIENGHPKDREALRQQLASGKSYRGVAGTMHFDSQGDVMRDLMTLTIQRRQIKPLTSVIQK